MSRTTPYAFGVMRDVFSWTLLPSMPGPKAAQTWEKKMREISVGRKRREGVTHICQRVGKKASLSAR